MSLSVVLPVRNGAHTLERALQSVLRQTRPPDEVLAVNDGSTDSTGALLRAFAGRHPCLRVLEPGPVGLVRALNLGLEAARGELVARMDADDESLPERFEQQLGGLHADPALELIAGKVRHGSEDGAEGAGRGIARYVEWVNGVCSPEEHSAARFVESPVIHPSVMFRRSCVQRWGGYREGDFPEDYELWLRWLEQGARMRKLTSDVLVWNDSGSRLTRTDPRYSARAFAGVKAAYLRRWLERVNPRHPEIWIWGAGRRTRQRNRPLLAAGLRPAGYVDVDPRLRGARVEGLPVLLPDELPHPGEVFLVSTVAAQGARQAIADYLNARGWVPGRHYILAS